MTTNRARLFENFCNVSHRVLGYDLKPLCLLHYLWLEQVESPLVDSSKTYAESELVKHLRLAALICSSSSSEEILKKLKNGKKWWRRLLAPKSKDLTKELNAFLAYIDDHFSTFEVQRPDSGPTIETVPWMLLHAASFMKETHCDEKTAWTTPIGRLVMYGHAFNELRGGKTYIVPDAERAAEQALAALRAS